MELNQGIQYILDGNAVILMGAGASYGAKNAFGNLPSGPKLAQYLYTKCGINPDDDADLQDAAQNYAEQFGKEALISEIRSQMSCASFTPSHVEIYSLPWVRYYTTNYDDVPILAAEAAGKRLVPITISSSFVHEHEKENLCIYINGHIGKLTNATLNGEFKLTTSSYLSLNNIESSQWGSFFANDLHSAKCIFILGLSLKYDLDISRIIYNPALIDKTIIIDSPTLSSNSEKRLNRFGKVYKIGIDAFADRIREIKATYTVYPKSPKDKLYTAFTYEYMRKYNLSRPMPDEIFRLFINGDYCDSLYYTENGKYLGCVERTCLSDIDKAIKDNKRIIFLSSDMGNGKTACINELRYRLSKERVHVFTLVNADSSKLSEEIAAICSMEKDEKVIIIIDDYTDYMEVLSKFSLSSVGNEQFILAARTALNFNKIPAVISLFSISENESKIISLNRLNDGELYDCSQIFEMYGLYGRRISKNSKERISILSSREGGNRRFQSIMLGVLESQIIKRKLEEIICLIKKESNIFHETVILILLIKTMNLRLTTVDIERITKLDVASDAMFRTNPVIKELLQVENNGEIKIKSSVSSKYILQKTADPQLIINVLLKIANYAISYSTVEKYNNILISIISYSHINSFIKGFQNPEQFLMEYFDMLSRVPYYRSNHFFWLQYAIACIETKRFDRAQQYLETAYGLIPKGFIPFQINNQQARLYLERIVNDQALNSEEELLKAHKLLMIPVTSEKDNEYNVVKLFHYYTRKKIFDLISSDQEKFSDIYKEAYNRTDQFIRKHAEYGTDLIDLKRNLLSKSFE